LLVCQRDGRLGCCLGVLGFSPELIEPRRHVQGPRQGVGVRDLPGQGERLLALVQGLVGIAQRPEDERPIRAAEDARVPAIQHGMAVVLLRIIETKPCL
jgi:hypothetical protein